MNTKHFCSTESKDSKFKVWISRPENAEAIITTSFDIFDYIEFQKAVRNLKYLNVKQIHKADTICTISIELTEPGALLKLMGDIAELLFEHVEKRDLQALPA